MRIYAKTSAAYKEVGRANGLILTILRIVVRVLVLFNIFSLRSMIPDIYISLLFLLHFYYDVIHTTFQYESTRSICLSRRAGPYSQIYLCKRLFSIFYTRLYIQKYVYRFTKLLRFLSFCGFSDMAQSKNFNNIEISD